MIAVFSVLFSLGCALVFAFSAQVARAEDIIPAKPSARNAGASALPTPRSRPASPMMAASGPDVCFAQIGSGQTFSSPDASAVQMAVDASAPNDLVKIAGICAGTQIRVVASDLYTQVVYISNSLTLEGGYPLDFLSASDPNAPTTLDAQQGGRVVYVQSGRQVTLTALHIMNGAVPQYNCNPECQGGGVFADVASVVRLENSILTNNHAFFGGGVANQGTLMVSHTTMTDNHANGIGGALYNFNTLDVVASVLDSNTAGAGGAGLGNEGTLTVTDSTVSNNIADDSNGKGSGGGLQNTEAGPRHSRASLINSTFANNQANGINDQGGGGIMSFYGSVALLNTTVSGNSSRGNSRIGRFGGGGINAMAGTTTTLQNSIVASNTSTVNRPDLVGTMRSSGGNVVGSTTGMNGGGIANNVNGDRAGNNASPLDPLLGPLGMTRQWSHLVPVLPGSPAIGILTGASCNGAPPFDQRNIQRNPPSCDAGAYQDRGFTFGAYFDDILGVPINMTSGDNQHAYVNSAFALPLSVTLYSYYDEPVIGGHITFASPSTGPHTNPITTVAVIVSNPYVIETPETFGGHGVATVMVNANNISGAYDVTVNTSGMDLPETFALTNDRLPADLQIALEATPTEGLPGQTVTYTLVYSNGGPGIANGVLITDILPSSLMSMAYTSSGVPITLETGTTYQWSAGNLPAGYGGIVTITGIIRPDVAGVSEITNTAVIAVSDATGSNASTATTGMWYGLQTLSDGNGTGSLQVDPPGPTYPYGTDIIVYPTADTGSHLQVWSDNCGGGAECHVQLSGNTRVTATFTLDTHLLDVTVTGQGQGVVQVNPPAGPYDYGTVVTLTAIPGPGSTFTGWSGDITRTERSFAFTITADTALTANFDALPNDLRLTLAGTSATAVPGQAVTYTLSYSNAGGGVASGTLITAALPSALTSIAYSHSGMPITPQGVTPYQWSVGALGAGQGGIVTITGVIDPYLAGVSAISSTAMITSANVAVPVAGMATTAIWYELRIARAGNGMGSLSVNAPGPAYPYNSIVIVSPTVGLGSHPGLSLWSSNCTVVDNKCNVTLTGTMYVTATFTLDRHTLNTSVTGKGHGSIQMNPPNGTYDFGTVVILTAVVSPASIFTGWSGCIASTQKTVTCTMNADAAVVASFDTRQAFVPMVARR